MKKKYVRKSKRRYSKRRYSKRRYSKRRNRVSRVSRRKLKTRSKKSKKSRKKSSRAGSSPLNEKVQTDSEKSLTKDDEDKLQEGPPESNRVYLTDPIQIFGIDYSRSGIVREVPIKSQKEFNVYIDNEENKLFIVWINGENSTNIQISVPVIKKIKQEGGKHIIFKIYSGDGENSRNALDIKVKIIDESKLDKFKDFEFPKGEKPEFFIKRR